MKNRILSFVLALTLVVSALLGTAVFAGAEGEPANIEQTALNLAENVTVKMLVSVNGEQDGDFAVVTLPNGEQVTTELANADKYGENYLFYAEVAVKDFAKEVTLELFHKDASVAYYTEATTAAAYCETYKAETNDGKFLPLIAALEVYAKAAAAYFDGGEAVTVDADLSAVKGANRAGTMPAGLTHRSATLLLESEATIRHYFQLDEGYSIENFRFFLDENNDGDADANEILTPASKLTDDGLTTVYYVDIAGITPNELDNVYTVGVFGAKDKATYTCAYGALTYAKGKAEGKNAKLANLVKALYNYNAEAGKLTGTVSFDDGKNMTYEYGVETPIVYVPTKAGYNFLGWFDSNGNQVSKVSAAQENKLELTAKWVKAMIDTRAFNELGNAYNGFCNNHTGDGICDTCKYCVKDCGATADAACEACGKKLVEISSIHSSEGGKKAANTGYTAVSTVNGIKGVEINFSSITNIQYNSSSGLSIPEAYAAGYRQIVYSFDAKSLESNSQVLPINLRTRYNNSNADFVIFRLNNDRSNKIKLLDNEVNISVDGTARRYEFILDMSNATPKGSESKGYLSMILKIDGVVRATAKKNLTDYVENFQTGRYYGNIRLDSAGGIWIANFAITPTASRIIYPAEASVPNVAPLIHTPGTATKLPDTAYKSGYVLEGWYADEALTQPISEIPAYAAGDVKIYAKWTEGTNHTYSFVNPVEYTNGFCPDHKDTNSDKLCDACGFCAPGFCTASNGACSVCGNELLTDKLLGSFYSTKQNQNFFYTRIGYKDGINGTIYGVSKAYGDNVSFGTMGNTTYADYYKNGYTHTYYDFVMARAYETGDVTPFTARIRAVYDTVDKDGKPTTAKQDLWHFNINKDGSITILGANSGVKLDMVARRYQMLFDITEGENKIIKAELYVDGVLAFATEKNLGFPISQYTHGDNLGQFRLAGTGAIWLGSIEAGALKLN